MILKFVHKDLTELSLAKAAFWIQGTETINSLSDLENIVEFSGLNKKKIINSEIIGNILQNKIYSSKSTKTPIDDRFEVPFIIDKNENPVSVVNSWIRHVFKTKSPKTCKTYAYALLDFLKFLEADNLVWQQATDEILLAYRKVQETMGSFRKRAANGQNDLSKNTIQSRILAVGWFFEYAEKYEYIDKNPLTIETIYHNAPVNTAFLAHIYSSRIKRQPISAYSKSGSKSPIKSLPHEVIWNWINSILDKRNKLIAKILYQTGMRREEVILLKVSDLPKKDYIENNSLEGVTFVINGKGGKKRDGIISKSLYFQIQNWINVKRKKILKRSGIKQDHGYLWVNLNNGNPLLVSAVNSFFKKHSENQGVEVTPHMMRHSFAMQKRHQLYESGLKNPEKRLQEILGHSSVVTTMTTYGHISPEDLSNEYLENLNFIINLTDEESM